MVKCAYFLSKKLHLILCSSKIPIINMSDSEREQTRFGHLPLDVLFAPGSLSQGGEYDFAAEARLRAPLIPEEVGILGQMEGALKSQGAYLVAYLVPREKEGVEEEGVLYDLVVLNQPEGSRNSNGENRLDIHHRVIHSSFLQAGELEEDGKPEDVFPFDMPEPLSTLEAFVSQVVQDGDQSECVPDPRSPQGQMQIVSHGRVVFPVPVYRARMTFIKNGDGWKVLTARHVGRNIGDRQAFLEGAKDLIVTENAVLKLAIESSPQQIASI
jgi:hypothetical protein